jgi:membrane-bound lytic murein transglycosylase B
MKRSLATLLLILLFAAPARAAQCGGDFSVFLSAMARDAQAAGLPRGIIDQVFAGVTIDPTVLAFDRRQHGTFRMNFERYTATRVTEGRLRRARVLMGRHAALLARVERQFGVPPPLLMAIWTMESDNGTGDMGRLPVIRTLATLAHDCRRSELFQSELIAGDRSRHGSTRASSRNSLCRGRTRSRLAGWRAGAPPRNGADRLRI